MKNAAARSHPLHIASRHLSFITETVTVLDRTGEYIGDGLDPTMRMPGKSGKVVRRILIAEVVQQQERIEILGFAETEGTLQLDTSTLECGLCLNNLFDWSD